ncbi:hypothetical protein KJ693_10995 [bacterium]|nr:hypothetical protein [bacterium]MBU1615816.1 hypothetical protein [bacterium]
MAVEMANYEETFVQELRDVPKEYLSNLLQIVHLFKESVTLKSAKESFRQGWKEVKEGKTYPVSELWEGISVE